MLFLDLYEGILKVVYYVDVASSCSFIRAIRDRMVHSLKICVIVCFKFTGARENCLPFSDQFIKLTSNVHVVFTKSSWKSHA